MIIDILLVVISIVILTYVSIILLLPVSDYIKEHVSHAQLLRFILWVFSVGINIASWYFLISEMVEHITIN